MIKIAFADVGDNGIIERFIMDCLGDLDVEISDNPDFVFCGDFETHDFLKYDCVRIYITGELEYPDLNVYDYVIGSLHLDLRDRYFRYPFYLWRDGTMGEYEDALHRDILSEKAFDRKFCNYMVSNGTFANPIRHRFFELLSKYRNVDSGGRYCNNIGYYVDDKKSFQEEYKFSIAFENESAPGYITEKIVEAYNAGTIPIYWGASDVKNEFNEKAFINVLEYNSIEDAIQEIKNIDRDRNEYIKVLNSPLVVDENGRRLHKEVGGFIRSIIGQEKEKAYRRSRYGRSSIIESRYKRDVYSRITDILQSKDAELSSRMRSYKFESIYIYGAGLVGKMLCDILMRNEVVVSGIIDRIKTGGYKKIPIINLNSFVNEEHKNTIVINSVYGIYNTVAKTLNTDVEDIFEIIDSI